MGKTLLLSKLLKSENFLTKGKGKDVSDKKFKHLQIRMLRIQQGIWHRRGRAIILFEGFDAAGKGGAIRRMVELLDPRGFQVHPIGPPTEEEKGTHYLARFWKRLPPPGEIAIFDRSWYGRVLVERVEDLTPKERWKAAYKEILEFEQMLRDDGISLVKIFLAISKDEQLRRFEERLNNPYKQWKLTVDDVRARLKWNDYVEAVDDMFKKTDTKEFPWNLIPADNKPYARYESLKTVTKNLAEHREWIEDQAQDRRVLGLAASLKKLGVKEASF